MILGGQELESQFYRGLYTAILAATVDGAGGGVTPEAAAWVVGSLSFVGRLVEAKAVLGKYEGEMERGALVAARCMLAINLARSSQYDDARATLLAAIRDRPRDDKAVAFCHLGLAFFHMTQGRYDKAERSASLALGRAITGAFLYGKVLARDLLAHSQVQAGRMAAALLEFRLAKRDAAALGAGAVPLAMRVSLAVHSARHGFAPQSDLAELREVRQDLSADDSFSAAKVLMELGRQCLLRGQADAAAAYYDEAAQVTGAQALPWFASRLAIRKAHLAWCQGEDELAHAILSTAEAQDVEGASSATHAEFNGLRRLFGLPERRGEPGGAAPFNAVDRRIRRRCGASALALHPPGDDPLGDLLDLIERQPEQAPDAIVRDGFLGLLARLPGLRRGGRALHFGLLPARVVIFERGNVRLGYAGKSMALEGLAALLATGWQSKEQLIQSLWGYRYNPSRHDALVYRAVGRLRAFVPEDWLQSAQGQYRLAPGILVVGPEARPAPVWPVAEAPLPLERPSLALRLSHRQLQLVRFVERTGAVDVKAAGAFLQLSDASARRELSQLVRSEFLARSGKGRATTYSRGVASSA